MLKERPSAVVDKDISGAYFICVVYNGISSVSGGCRRLQFERKQSTMWRP